MKWIVDWFRRACGDACQKLSGVGVLRDGEYVVGAAAFHDASLLENDDLVAKRGDDAEVVGDENQRHLGGELLEQFDDADAGGEIERADRLVGKQQLRPCDDGAGDGDALALAAREFMRIAVSIARLESDRVQRGRDRVRLVAGDAERPQRFGDDVEDVLARIERGIGVLEHRLHLPAIGCA